jgi:tryptophan synthase alpha chain
LKGVTGAAIKDKGDIKGKIEHLRTITDLPVIVGFGIKDAQSAVDMAVISDGVIVGSALVDRISHLRSGETYSQAALADTVAVISSIRQAIDNIK